MRTVRNLVVLAALAPIYGCAAPLVVDGFEVDRRAYELQRASLLKRAAFDLNCPEARLRTTLLETDFDKAKQFGVVGCDQRLTYVSPDSWQTWILNAASGQPVAAPK